MQKKQLALAALFTALLLLFAVPLRVPFRAPFPCAAAECAKRAEREDLAALPEGEPAGKRRIYLTFDDGPSTVVTGRVLDTLHREGVKATFFIVSDRVPGREEVLRRIVREGHTVGVHSATHDYSAIYASDEALLSDVAACAECIRRVTGVTARCYRFPGGGGARREQQTALLEELGYRVVRWNAVCGDEEVRGADAETLVGMSIRTAGKRNTVVLLLHDSAPHKATAEALPAIIAHFRARGYAFCAY